MGQGSAFPVRFVHVSRVWDDLDGQALRPMSEAAVTDQQSAEVEALREFFTVNAMSDSPQMDWVDVLAQRVETLTRERDHWKEEVAGLASEQRVAERAEAQRDRLAEALRRMEEPCPDCNGSGDLTNGEECDWCSGSGLVMKPVTEMAEIQRAALREIEQAASNEGEKTYEQVRAEREDFHRRIDW